MGYKYYEYNESAEAEGKVSVRRTCEFCNTEYFTTPITLKAQGYNTYRSDSWWFKGKDASTKALENLENRKRDTRRWLIEGTGRYKVGVLCPQCHRFSSVCNNKQFKKGKSAFLIKLFYKHVFWDVWVKISLICWTFLSIPAVVPAIFFGIILWYLRTETKFLHRLDQIPVIFKYSSQFRFVKLISEEDADFLLKEAYIKSGSLAFGKAEIFDEIIKWLNANGYSCES